MTNATPSGNLAFGEIAREDLRRLPDGRRTEIEQEVAAFASGGLDADVRDHPALPGLYLAELPSGVRIGFRRGDGRTTVLDFRGTAQDTLAIERSFLRDALTGLRAHQDS